MKLRNIALILSREYSVRVKKKSFILTTIVTPILFALLMVAPTLIMLNSGEVCVIEVVDNSSLASNYLKNSNSIEYRFIEDRDVDSRIKIFNDLGVYALIEISSLDSNGDISVKSYSKEPMNMDVKSDIVTSMELAVRDLKLRNYNIDNLDKILEDVKSDVRLEALTITESGDTKEDSVEIYMIISYILSFMIYMFVFMFGNMVMRSVIEEKSNRIVEVIISTVSSFELMMGKILGVAAVALTQFMIWVALTFGIVFSVNSVIVEDLISSSQMQETSEITNIVSSFASVDFSYIICCFLIFFLLGYLLYASMFAAVGSAVDNEADTGQLAIPITIPLILGLFIMMHTFQHPNSQLSFWASIIPFTSPMVMLSRIPFGVVPAWELALSIAVLFITFVIVTYLAGKIYHVGILMYGKKASFKDLYKWIKQTK